MEYKNMKEFWSFYLSEHSHPFNRRLHFIGSLLGLLSIGLAIYFRNPWFLLGGLVSGYAFAWIGHFLVEKNRPATFKYPLKSFAGDWIMFYYTITGQIEKELEKYSIGK
ncbi:MAG: DUF962 domain-containing protein [Leptospira sp.]|nr:DUF962 domain-containing protein [Leptospira sp.]